MSKSSQTAPGAKEAAGHARSGEDAQTVETEEAARARQGDEAAESAVAADSAKAEAAEADRSDAAQPAVAAAADPAEISRGALGRLVMAAWMAILLGLAMQGLILLGRLAGGAPLPEVTIAANIASGVTWALVVCLSVGVATMVTRAPIALTGLIGLIGAPLALGSARGVQRGINQLIGGPEEQIVTLAVATGAGIKALQYGLLTIMLVRLVRAGEQRIGRYMALGAATGLVFGSAFIAAAWYLAAEAGNPLPRPALIGMAINEFLFPIGCAMIIYAIQFVGRHVKIVQEAGAQRT